MQEFVSTKFIQTNCGKTFLIDFLDQVALGIYAPGKFKETASFIPSTYALYKTATPDFILEITRYNENSHQLETDYQLLSPDEARNFLETDGANILIP
jgi:hypothetical protein